MRSRLRKDNGHRYGAAHINVTDLIARLIFTTPPFGIHSCAVLPQ